MSTIGKINVMIVDARVDVYHQLDQALKARHPNINTVSCTTGRKALDRLTLMPVKALLVAARLPDMPARQLIDATKAKISSLDVLVYVEPTQNEMMQSYRLAAIPCVKRTPDWGDLITTLEELLTQGGARERRSIEDMRLPEAVEMLSQQKATVQLRVISGDDLGAVAFENGEPMHAHTGHTQGEAALRQMLEWSDTKLEVMHIAKTDARSIFKSATQVLEETIKGKAPPPKPKPAEVAESPAQPAPQPKIKDRKPRKHKAKKEQKGQRDVWREIQKPAPKKSKTPPKKKHKRIRIPKRRLALIAIVILGVLVVSAVYLAQNPEQIPVVKERILEILEKGTDVDIKLPGQQEPEPFARAVIHRRTDFPSLGEDEEWVICRAPIQWLPQFSDSGNAVVLSADVFDQLRLGTNAWIELRSTGGSGIGAYALRSASEHTETVWIRESMGRALGMNPAIPGSLAVRPLIWPQPQNLAWEVTFHTTRVLPVQYCEQTFAAGLGIEAMDKYGLLPGAYVIVKGPVGFQSATVQLMDRGNPDQIWLSKSVQDAIGITGPRQSVTVFRKLKP